MKILRKKYKEIVWRLPHHTWTKERIIEELAKRDVVKEIEVPAINPVIPEEQVSKIDPALLQLLAGQQAILSKVVDSLDEIKDGMKDLKPVTPEEARAEFDNSIKNTHFEAKYSYEIYAFKYKSTDGSEERGMTGKLFNNKEEAEAYGMKEHGASKFKLMKIKKPKLVNNTSCSTDGCGIKK